MSVLGEFLLMARFKGALPAEQDGYYYPHLVLHVRAQYALGEDLQRAQAAAHLADLDADPDDEVVLGLLEKWRAQLFGARTISCGGRGRRPKDEMEFIRFHLYLLAAQERPATVRSIYYRAVSKGLVPKTEGGYRTVQQQLLGMRRNKLLPWHWITDTSRRVWGYRRFKDLQAYAEHVARNYYVDYWQEAPHNVEVWCEKEAMYGVLAPVVVEEYGLSLYVSKGQSSASYLYEAAEAMREDGRPAVVYILADFDPAGFRIAGKIEAGLREHLGDGVPVGAHRIAVTHEQMEDPELDIPTRPVKKSDQDAAGFVARYGDVSAELEAVPSNTLREMVRAHLKSHIEPARLKVLKMVEEQEREGLAQLQDLIGGAA